MNLALIATGRIRNSRSGNADQTGPDEIQSDITQLLLGKALPGQSKLKNWNARRVILNYEWRRGARRQLTQQRLRNGGNLGDCIADLNSRMKENLYDADAVQRLGFDMLDIIDGSSEHALLRTDNAFQNYFWRKAR